MAKEWVRKVDSKMKSYGDTNFENKTIRVNPRKGGLINTVIHEELHRSNPNKTEKQIKKMVNSREAKCTPKKAISLLKKYR